MQRVNHNSTTTKGALGGAGCGFMDNSESRVIKSVFLVLRIILLFLFLYLWNYWSAMMIFFRGEDVVYYSDYLITFPFNMGLLFAVLPFFKVFVYLSAIPLLFTTYTGLEILIFGQAKDFGALVLVSNLIAVMLFLYNGIYVNKSRICLKRIRI